MKRLAQWVFNRGKKEEVPTGPFRPRILLFDFDGTVGDTFIAGVEILNKLADEFKFRRLKPEEVEGARDMTTMEFIRFLGVPTTKIVKVSKRGVKEFRSRIDGVNPFPHIIPVLKELHKQGYLLGIVTSNAEENVARFLKRHHIECFDFIRCSSRLMGKARVIKSLMKEKKMKPEEVLFVGDETRDIEATKKAGIQIAAVTWGYNSRRALEGQNPEYILDHPDELIPLLAELTKNADEAA
ncbi:MAG: HAD-IA family hydrolase [Chthoniobacterales bacterium]